MTTLRNIGRLWSPGEPVRSNVEVVIQEGRIAAVQPTGTAAPERDDFDCRGLLLTPGLIDAHTHPLYLRPRLEEVQLRSEGVAYSEIAARDGGILETVRATRTASWEELTEATRQRLQGWRLAGTTTVEVKTGYHLRVADELRAVSLLSGLRAEDELPDLSVTYLAAHELPKERSSDRAGYVAEVAESCPQARAQGARSCDVFCDQGAFTVEEARQMLEAAGRAGLRLRIHADELALTGGSLLAAELGADSADHLLRIGEREAGLLSRAGVAATLCPVTALSMRALPPARELLRAGVTLALGSDHNPGTSGAGSMSLVVYLAVSQLGLSVDEALTAATLGGARSLHLAERGAIRIGMRADLSLWDADHEGGFGWAPQLACLASWREGLRSAAT
jgi:imidazolonepropionase